MTLYPASDRGHFDLGWLNTHHTFSFGHYMRTDRMGFGALRVFNDDVVAPGEGFGTHPHNNMEIISIPLSGVIAHRDSMGNEQGLTPGYIQVMSAGTGLTHSEYNGSATDPLAFLQIWIIPNERNVAPRYQETNVDNLAPNTLHAIVGPQSANLPLWIYQNAFLSIGKLKAGTTVEHAPLAGGLQSFVFVIEGAITVNGTPLSMRDAVGLTPNEHATIAALEDGYILVIDVPLL